MVVALVSAVVVVALVVAGAAVSLRRLAVLEEAGYDV